MKYLIIIIIIIVLFFLVTHEDFDVSANLNLLTNSNIGFNKAINIPISPNLDEDREVPNPVLFDNKVNITILQKLKAINNILERIKDISIIENNSNKQYNLVTFNPALLPVQKFEPDMDKLVVLNKILSSHLKYYSGNQYILNVLNIDNAYGAETDNQYRIAYILYGIIDNIKMKILIDLIITKSATTDTDLNIVYTELRIDNPNVYITPYNNENLDNYESINNYSKSLK